MDLFSIIRIKVGVSPSFISRFDIFDHMFYLHNRASFVSHIIKFLFSRLRNISVNIPHLKRLWGFFLEGMLKIANMSLYSTLYEA